MVFAKEPPAERAYTFAASNLTFKIPPQDPNYEVDAKQVFPTAPRS